MHGLVLMQLHNQFVAFGNQVVVADRCQVDYYTSNWRIGLKPSHSDALYRRAVDRDLTRSAIKRRIGNIYHQAVRTRQLHGLRRDWAVTGDLHIQSLLTVRDRDRTN